MTGRSSCGGPSGLAELAAPFSLAGVLEPIDVRTVEILARQAGVDQPRVLLGLAFALRAPRLGHVGVELARVREQVALERKLELPFPPEPSWAEETAACVQLVDREGSGRQPFVALGEDALPCGGKHPLRLVSRRYFALEQAAAEGMKELLKREGAHSPMQAERNAARALERLESGQEPLRRAARLSLCRRLMVLTGGPGSGKTFAIKFILYAHWLAGEGRPPAVALAAPTGKAARRLKEALAEGLEETVPDPAARRWMASLEPVTLHRLLGASRFRPGEFLFGEDSPLPFDLVVVDEASMVDLALMAGVLAATGRRTPGATLVLVGDPDQLASVEAGCVLSDLCQGLGEGAGSALVRLTGQYRTRRESPLRRLAESMAAGDGPATRALLSAGSDELQFIPLEEERLDRRTLGCILAGYGAFLQACRNYSRPVELLRSLEKFCLLTPYRSGELGVAGLNRTMERWLSQQAGLKGWFDTGRDWYAGRPILVEENSYELSLMNGDVGVVVPTDAGLQAAFWGVESGEQPVLFSPAVLPTHRTVFAMTVHKSQGSQFEKVALVLPPRDTPLLTRELIYTAVTRARERLVLIGSEQAFVQALSRRIRRASGLAALLGGGARPPDPFPA